MLDLAPSRRAAAVIFLACMATLAVLAAMPLPFAAHAAAFGWCGFASIAALRRVAWHRGANAVRSLSIAAGAVEVEDGRGALREGELRQGSFVAPWLTVVRWRPEGARLSRSILILPDMVDAEGFRALRVLLRWAPPPR